MRRIDWLAAAAVAFAGATAARATALADLQTWYGTGPNRAGFEIDWNDGTANRAMAFGYRWSGTATGGQMLDAVVAGDPRLYAEVSSAAVFGFGYDAVTDRPFGPTLSPALSFDAGHLAHATYAGVVDARAATSTADKWQEGWYSAGYWGYYSSTDARLAANVADWGYATAGLSSRTLADGDWDGFGFARGFAEAVPAAAVAPGPAQVPEPTGLAGVALAVTALARRRRRVAAAAVAAVAAARPAVAAYTYDPNDFATAVVSYTGATDGRAAYNDPSAALGQPPLTFNNSLNPNVPDVRSVKVVEPPYNYGPGTAATRQTLLTLLPAADPTANPGGSTLTVRMGRPVTDDPRHPYGDDLIVFGNGFYTGTGGVTSDATNLNGYTVAGLSSHPVQVSVSPDGATWFAFPVTAALLPYQAYRWDPAAAAYTADVLNPTVPLSPATVAANFAGASAADVLAAYGDSAGGTPYDIGTALDSAGRTLAQDGFASVQYVRFASTAADYAVVAGVSAVSVPVPEPAGVVATGVGALVLGRRRRA